jgi:hypothetical protein
MGWSARIKPDFNCPSSHFMVKLMLEAQRVEEKVVVVVVGGCVLACVCVCVCVGQIR